MLIHTFENIAQFDLDKVVSVIVELSKKHPIIVVNGEMGAGKTTLISAVCKALEVTSTLSSPTYSIVNSYHSALLNDEVYHFDFYRLKDEMEAVQSGLDELIDSGKLCFIEWAERITKLLPETYVRINISISGTELRNIEITIV